MMTYMFSPSLIYLVIIIYSLIVETENCMCVQTGSKSGVKWKLQANYFKDRQFRLEITSFSICFDEAKHFNYKIF
jgi:hypothetical protein